MEDFEYSVEICNRDWECFFAECEECNLLSPSLAGLDDSGMSDIDDTGSILAKRAQRVVQPAGLLDSDWPMDGPPDCEGSPVEDYLSKHGIGGIESVLSGSEEDIHLQSVNMFFEGLKGLTESERPSEPSQLRIGKNSEAAQEEEEEEKEKQGEVCGDWQLASGITLPKNIPELNCLPARGETAVGKKTSRPADTMSHGNTMEEVARKIELSCETAASEIGTNTLDKATFLIKEDVRAETSLKTMTHQSLYDSSETTPKVEMCTFVDDTKHNGLLTNQLPLSEKPGTDLAINLPIALDVKRKKDQTPHVSQPDTASAHKSASQESSPASIRKRRRKKRRLGVEPGDGAHGCERTQSDSEDEKFALKGGLPFSDEISFYGNERQTNVMANLNPRSPSCSSTDILPAQDVRVNDPPCDIQCGRTRCAAAGSGRNITPNNRSVKPLSQLVDNVLSVGNNSANVTDLQPCCVLSSTESNGLTRNSQKFVGFIDKSELTNETPKIPLKVACLKKFIKVHKPVSAENQHTVMCHSAEVKPVSPPPRADSNAPTVDFGQNDRLSAAMLSVAEEAGNSRRDEHTLCQNEAEPQQQQQQQLEIDCHNTKFDSTLLEKIQSDWSAIGSITSRQHCMKPQELRPRSNPLPDEISNAVTCIVTSTKFGLLHGKSSLSGSDINVTVQQTEGAPESQALSRTHILQEQKTQAEWTRLPTSQMSMHTSISGPETKPSLSGGLVKSLSDLTHVSSLCTLDTESIMSLSNENITDLSASFCSSASEGDSEGHEEKSSTTVDHKDGDAASEFEIKPELKGDLVSGAVNATETCSEPKKELNSVFAMSSFWSEMEKLTINDILGLRMMNKAAASSFLPPLKESEEGEILAATDSGFFTQLDESKTEESDNIPSGLKSVERNSTDFSSLKSATWERKSVQSADFPPGNIMLTTMTDPLQSILPAQPHKGLRKISKNVSVHNLRALGSESFSSTQTRTTLQTEREPEEVERSRDRCLPKEDLTSSPSSLTDSYSVSLTDVFQYLFGGKQSEPSQSAPDSTSTFFTDGNSDPESYDHFFSDFDTESFFYPLTTAEDKDANKPVLIFSCSRSATRNLQYPEAYDYFFKSSSSDDSSADSDEEENCSPVRVVTRLSRKTSSSCLSTDIYDHFFTDSDLQQNLFWKTTFSFRNVNFTASTVQRETADSASLVPVRESDSSVPRAVRHLNVLGNQDVMSPDPLLHHLEERIPRQLPPRPFTYEELQMAVSSPGLDRPFLPLKQSDMCLVCIAFASWVLKTTNPQVGDAWKAVLLANVSALSAIRYLRKYVRVKGATSEMKPQLPALTEF